MLHVKYLIFRPFNVEKDFLKVFLAYFYRKRGIILTIFVPILQAILHAKYLISWVVTLEKMKYLVVLLYFYKKTCDPCDGTSFGPMGIISTVFVKVR